MTLKQFPPDLAAAHTQVVNTCSFGSVCCHCGGKKGIYQPLPYTLICLSRVLFIFNAFLPIPGVLSKNLVQTKQLTSTFHFQFHGLVIFTVNPATL